MYVYLINGRIFRNKKNIPLKSIYGELYNAIQIDNWVESSKELKCYAVEMQKIVEYLIDTNKLSIYDEITGTKHEISDIVRIESGFKYLMCNNCNTPHSSKDGQFCDCCRKENNTRLVEESDVVFFKEENKDSQPELLKEFTNMIISALNGNGTFDEIIDKFEIKRK
mgnify:CR=1 FL=1